MESHLNGQNQAWSPESLSHLLVVAKEVIYEGILQAVMGQLTRGMHLTPETLLRSVSGQNLYQEMD